MKRLEGHQDAQTLRFGLVVSKFNDFVTARLLAGALDALTKAGADPETIAVARVPGAFEIPLVARTMAMSGTFDAVICLGAVIKGETPHFEYIAAECARGIGAAALESGVPVIFGVLTTSSVDQAMARSGAPETNRGAEAAHTAIEMASLMRQLREKTPSGKKLSAASRTRRGGRRR
ncbi:MAG TPA: 6,7-dimethyl-8-ribityllumazine synthase [Nitrospirales bacterium]|nr:6,7-dimethyl-8-ribityllumazine synthase [Nitrospirales bacterium]